MDYVSSHVVNKFRGWIKFVELYRIYEVRIIKSFHDEPLKKRKDERSIRLIELIEQFKASE